MTVGVDFDFARYVAFRRGAQSQQAHDGNAYAFSGERRFRRGLAAARPVTMALEATTRLWRSVARAELLGTCIKVSDQQYPRVWEAARVAGTALRVRVPAIFVAPPTQNIKARTLGTDEAPYIIIGAQAAEQLGEQQLVALLGHELAHIHNGHVLYNTALYYLNHSAVFFVRWIVQPAIVALQAWSRRAEISCDRGAMLACKSLETALTTMVRMELGTEASAQFRIEEYLRDVPDTARGLGRYAELFRSHPYLPKRVQAMRWFADSSLFAAATGGAGKLATSEVDARVTDLIAVF